jgi:hypothetical protein
MKSISRESISFETPEVFVPTPTHLDILRAVADNQSYRISQIVQKLYPGHSESNVRSGVRVLLSKRYLDGGKSSSEIVIRLTSRGRLLILPPPSN